MTVEEVKERVRAQSADHLTDTNDRRMSLQEALVAHSPKQRTVDWRTKEVFTHAAEA
jgi:hypothetical protein